MSEITHNVHQHSPQHIADACQAAMKDAAGTAEPLAFTATVSHVPPNTEAGTTPTTPEHLEGAHMPKSRTMKGAARAKAAVPTPSSEPVPAASPTPEIDPVGAFGEKWSAQVEAAPVDTRIFCRRCSEPCAMTARFCSACGAALVEPRTAPEAPKTPMILDAPGSVPARRPYVDGEPCSYARVFPRAQEHLTGNLGVGWWGATTIVLEAGVWHRVVPSVAARLAKLLEPTGKPTVQITDEANYRAIRAHDQGLAAAREQDHRMQSGDARVITSQMVTGAPTPSAPMPPPPPSTFEIMHGGV